jgi:hypothetical protein
MGEKLKSAVELAMERLSQGEQGPAAALTEEQKQQIAELRNRTAAKLAEQEILHKAELAKLAALPPAEALERRLKAQQGFVDERARLERDRDSKIERIRSRAPGA